MTNLAFKTAAAAGPTVPKWCPMCGGVHIEREWGGLWRCVKCWHLFTWTPKFIHATTVEVPKDG